jgi:hypothetical protein
VTGIGRRPRTRRTAGLPPLRTRPRSGATPARCGPVASRRGRACRLHRSSEPARGATMAGSPRIPRPPPGRREARRHRCRRGSSGQPCRGEQQSRRRHPAAAAASATLIQQHTKARDTPHAGCHTVCVWAQCGWRLIFYGGCGAAGTSGGPRTGVRRITATSFEPRAFWNPGPDLTSQTSPTPSIPQDTTRSQSPPIIGLDGAHAAERGSARGRPQP